MERRDDWQVTCPTSGITIASSEFTDPINQFCNYLAPLQIASGNAENQQYLASDGKLNFGLFYSGTAYLGGSFGGNGNCQAAFQRILDGCDQGMVTKRGGLAKDTIGSEKITLYIGTQSSFSRVTAPNDTVAASTASSGTSTKHAERAAFAPAVPASHDASTLPVRELGEDFGICWPTGSVATQNEFLNASDLFCNWLRGLQLKASDYPTVQSYVISSGNVFFEVNFNDSDSSGTTTVGFSQCFDIADKIRDQCEQQDGQHGGRWFYGQDGGTFELAIYPNIPQAKAAVKRDTDIDHAKYLCWSGETTHSVDDVNGAAESYCTNLWPQLLQSQGGEVWKAYPVPGGDVEFRATWYPASNGLYTTTATCADHINTILQSCDQGTTQTEGGELNVTSSNGFLLLDVFTTLDDRELVVSDASMKERHPIGETKRDGGWTFMHEGAVNVECGAGDITASADSILKNGGDFCASVINHPWSSGQVMQQNFQIGPNANMLFHMQYNGPSGAPLAGATCLSWLQILTTQCPYRQGGGVEMKTWTMFLGMYSGPSFVDWAFSKTLDPAQSKKVNISDFNGTSSTVGNYSGTSN